MKLDELEKYQLEINTGDEVKMGKFKNRKATVKSISKDDHNQPVLKTNKGDKKLLAVRVSKLEETAVNFSKWNDQYEAILRDCKPWLLESNFNRVYRGIDIDPIDKSVFKKIRVRTDRKPSASRPIEQAAIDTALKANGFTTLRSNSIFCTGAFDTATSYGELHLIFPIGEFSYAWSPKIRDLFAFADKFKWFGYKTVNSTKNQFYINSYKLSAIHFALRSTNYYVNSKGQAMNIEVGEGFKKNARDEFKLYCERNGHTLGPYWAEYIAGDFPKIMALAKQFLKTLPIEIARTIRNYYRENFLKSVMVNKEVYKDTDIFPRQRYINKVIGELYQSTRLVDAIDSRMEIMVHCQEYYAYFIPKRSNNAILTASNFMKGLKQYYIDQK